jgi:hypothetical protein
VSLSLLVILSLGLLFLGCNASDLVLGVPDQVLPLGPESLLITADGVIELLGQLRYALLLELQLLGLERLVTFEVDLLGREVVERLGDFRPQSFDLLVAVLLLGGCLLAGVGQGLLALGKLLHQGVLLVLEGSDLALLPGQVSCAPLDPCDQLPALLVELIELLLELCLRALGDAG